MQLTITLPPREQTLAFHRQRWEEVARDPQWNEHPYRIETNAWGQIVMTPPPAVIHARRQFRLASLIEEQIGGFSTTECPVITSDGVKGVDVGWYSKERFEQSAGMVVAETAPEICAEILSPSNTVSEMETKRQLYFDSGAIECWICDLQGRMSYYHKDAPNESQPQSKLCPSFPNTITP